MQQKQEISSLNLNFSLQACSVHRASRFMVTSTNWSGHDAIFLDETIEPLSVESSLCKRTILGAKEIFRYHPLRCNFNVENDCHATRIIIIPHIVLNFVLLLMTEQ